MPREDVEFELSNLADLRNALGHKADALSLLAAFDVESLTSTRQALRRVAADWATPGSRLYAIEPPADEVGS